MAALMAAALMSVPVLADEETPEETTAEESIESVETAVEEEAEQENRIAGYYFVNYGQTEGSVNLDLIFVSDLTAVSEQADTVIYNFRDDGTVVIYDRGTRTEGTWSDDGSVLTVSAEEEHSYTYEFLDSLLIFREGDESCVLYDFSLDTGVELDDYSVLEIDKASVEITEEYLDQFLSEFLQGQATTEVVTEGVTETGDIVTISFVGVLEGETEPFEGGSGEGYTLTLGSGALIDTYEDQLTGQEIGSTVDVVVTFPEDYQGSENLKGKTAIFTTTIESKTVVTVPELTDEWAHEYSLKYLPEELETADAFREYCRKYLSDNALHSAIFQALAEKLQNVEYPNSTLAQLLMNYSSLYLSDIADYYGMDMETAAQQMGYSSAEAYVQYEASSNIMCALLIDKVMQDLDIIYTDTEFQAQLAENLKETYGDTMTAEEYMEQSGVVGVWAYTNLQYKYNLVTKALEDRVVLTEESAETTEEEAAAATEEETTEEEAAAEETEEETTGDTEAE